MGSVGSLRLVAALVLTLLAAGGCDDGDALPDDLRARLEAIPGLRVAEFTPSFDGYPGHDFYRLEYQQPVDHANARGQRFVQRMKLTTVGSAAVPMVQVVAGYEMVDDPVLSELTPVLGANQLTVEHRYFGASNPAPLDWSYLDLEQEAGDLHRINQALRPLFHGKWVATGASKGGITALAYRRFYPDDVDVTVAYVAPGMISTADPRFLRFFSSVGPDPVCRQALADFQRAALAAREELLVELHKWAPSWTFELVGEDRALEYAVEWLPFTFWQYYDARLCQRIPPPDASPVQLLDFLDGVNSLASWSDADLRQRRSWHYQAATEIGWPRLPTAHIADLLRYPGSNAPTTLASFLGVPLVYDPAPLQGVRDWLASSCERVLFVDGQNDPWSAAKFELPTSMHDCQRFIEPSGNHGADLTHLGANDRALASRLLGRWLGTTVVLPRPEPRYQFARPLTPPERERW